MPIVIALFLTMSAMPAGEFSALQKRIADTSFPKDQMKLIKRLPKTTTFSCEQVASLMEEFSFAKDKITLIEALTPRLDDLANRHVIIDALTFSGDKEQAGEILDRAYADEVDMRHREAQEAEAAQKARAAQMAANAKAAREARAAQRAQEVAALRALSHKKQIDKLRAWEERLSAKEDALERRERALERREARLRDAQKAVTKMAVRPKRQGLSWIGYCPMGISAKRVAKGECAPFDPSYFNPTSEHGQRLMVKVDKPGPVTFNIESGPRLRRCKPLGNRTTTSKQTVKTMKPNQVIDVANLIDNWDVDYIRITASSKGQKVSMRIDDWQGCGR